MNWKKKGSLHPCCLIIWLMHSYYYVLSKYTWNLSSLFRWKHFLHKVHIIKILSHSSTLNWLGTIFRFSALNWRHSQSLFESQANTFQKPSALGNLLPGSQLLRSWLFHSFLGTEAESFHQRVLQVFPVLLHSVETMPGRFWWTSNEMAPGSLMV